LVDKSSVSQKPDDEREDERETRQGSVQGLIFVSTVVVFYFDVEIS